MAREKAAPAGAPLWMVTFADLMSILLTFFILILSFSSLDTNRYRDMVGSVEQAFGMVKESRVAGVIEINGKPIFKEIMIPIPLETMPAPRIAKPIEEGIESARAKEDENGDEKDTGAQGSGQAEKKPTEGQEGQVASREAVTKEEKEKAEKEKAAKEAEKAAKAAGRPGEAEGKGAAGKKESLGLGKEEQPGLDEMYRRLAKILKAEIVQEKLELNLEKNRIIIRFPSHIAFDSGSDELRRQFLALLDTVARVLTASNDAIIVAGHTDDVPISTARFRSNWDLSSARAVSVVHRLQKRYDIDPARITAQGFADTRPLRPNSTSPNRAKNRRVEIIIQRN